MYVIVSRQVIASNTKKRNENENCSKSTYDGNIFIKQIDNSNLSLRAIHILRPWKTSIKIHTVFVAACTCLNDEPPVSDNLACSSTGSDGSAASDRRDTRSR